MKKYWKIIPSLLCTTMLVCSCTKEPTIEVNNQVNNIEEAAHQGKLDILRPMAYGNVDGLNIEPGSYISIIGKNQHDSFWDEIQAGAKQAVADLNKALGYEGSDKIKLNYSAPKNPDDIDEQINILDEELARYPIALGIATIDASACQVQFDLARENGIPIVMLDSGSEYKDVATTCATNNKKAAETAAVKLASAIDKQGEIAVFLQDSKSMSAIKRKTAFLRKIKTDFPDVKVVRVYHFDQLAKMQKRMAKKLKMDIKDIEQKDVIQWLLEKNPNLKGIFTANLDVTQAVAQVVADMGKTDVKIVGFDGGKEQLALLEEGKVEGLIIQNPFGMGYATVVSIARSSLGMANEAFVNCGHAWVTKETLSDEKVQKLMY